MTDVLTVAMADELLARIEKRRSDPLMRGPPSTVTDLIVPIEIMHELLMLWKLARLSAGIIHVNLPPEAP